MSLCLKAFYLVFHFPGQWLLWRTLTHFCPRKGRNFTARKMRPRYDLVIFPHANFVPESRRWIFFLWKRGENSKHCQIQKIEIGFAIKITVWSMSSVPLLPSSHRPGPSILHLECKATMACFRSAYSLSRLYVRACHNEWRCATVLHVISLSNWRTVNNLCHSLWQGLYTRVIFLKK